MKREQLLTCITWLLFSMHAAYGQPKITDRPSRNDHMFPAAPGAKPFIDYDARGFLVNGRRIFIVSAGIEYARVPSESWCDRLLKLKRGGFNTVEVYTFWNFHEPKEGEFNFTGDHDLGAFLRLVKGLGMYAIVRVGPYYCGEWSFGGYPIWLKFKPGLRVREDNPPFLSAVDNFFNKLIPIVAEQQVHRGGPVILVQLENEHPEGWGTIAPNGYFQRLIQKTTTLGLEVPYFFSGLHPGNDPAGDESNLDDPKRPNPWFSTEFWGVWFFNYGPQPQDSSLYDRRTWKIIAHGGAGYNVYMAHGGSNFDYNNDRDMAASYDYGAAVGQAGDLRPIYFAYKRAAWFARSFQTILANSTGAGSAGRWAVRNAAVKVTARTGQEGTIVFLDNPTKTALRTQIYPPDEFKSALPVPLTLAGGEIMAAVRNYKVAPGITLSWAPTRVFGIVDQGATTTLILYGSAGAPAKLYFTINGAVKMIAGGTSLRAGSGGRYYYSSIFRQSTPSEAIFEVDGKRLRILALSNALARRTWIMESGEENMVITGPSFASELSMNNGSLTLVTERPWQERSEGPVWVYRSAGTGVNMTQAAAPLSKRLASLALSSWQVKSLPDPTSAHFDDSSWLVNVTPLQMGADGDSSAYAWYRTRVTAAKTGKYTLRFKNVRERASLFVDGRKSGADLIEKGFSIDLEAGRERTIAVFVAHTGRNKQLFYRGVLDTIDAKGLSGEVLLEPADPTTAVIPVRGWRLKGGPGDPDGPGNWVSSTGKPASGPLFFRSEFTLPKQTGDQTTIWRVITTSLGHGSVWINGHNLGRYPEKIKVNGLYIPEPWLKEGLNRVVIYDEDGSDPSKVLIVAETAAGRSLTKWTVQ